VIKRPIPSRLPLARGVDTLTSRSIVDLQGEIEHIQSGNYCRASSIKGFVPCCAWAAQALARAKASIGTMHGKCLVWLKGSGVCRQGLKARQA